MYSSQLWGFFAGIEEIAAVLAGRYMVARETAKRQRARTAKEEDQDMKSIQVNICYS